MTRGNFTIAFLDVSIDKIPQSWGKKFDVPVYDMRIIEGDNTGRIYGIPKAEAEKMAKEILQFKRKIKAEMMAAAKKYKQGKR